MNVEYSEANWKDNKLFVRKKDTKISLLQDLKHPKMWWIQDNGKIGNDFYNKTRAKDNAMRMYQGSVNKNQDTAPPEGS